MAHNTSTGIHYHLLFKFNTPTQKYRLAWPLCEYAEIFTKKWNSITMTLQSQSTVKSHDALCHLANLFKYLHGQQTAVIHSIMQTTFDFTHRKLDVGQTEVYKGKVTWYTESMQTTFSNTEKAVDVFQALTEGKRLFFLRLWTYVHGWSFCPNCCSWKMFWLRLVCCYSSWKLGTKAHHEKHAQRITVLQDEPMKY